MTDDQKRRDFVRTGELDPEIAACFSRLMTFRQNADYVAEYVFTEAMAREQVEGARHFVAAAPLPSWRRRAGWTAPLGDYILICAFIAAHGVISAVGSRVSSA